jgi:TusE/DsrC/DsvC family sulfur relay protein
MEIEVSGKKVLLDDEGYLVNSEDWSEEVARALAQREGIGQMDKEKIDMLKFIREYYQKHNFFPILNAVCKNVHLPKDCVSVEFMNPLKAWKLAGFPKPDENIVSILEHGQTPG